MIFYSTPFRSDKNVGRYYNDFMGLLSEDDWACFTDGDAMFTTPFYGKQIEDCIKDDAVYTAVTNRVMVPYQTVGDWSSNDMAYHRQLGDKLYREKYASVTDITNQQLLSGVLILISKKLWKKLGGFDEGTLGVDNSIHRKARDLGEKVYLMGGVYLMHWYRGGNKNDKSHLQ